MSLLSGHQGEEEERKSGMTHDVRWFGAFVKRMPGLLWGRSPIWLSLANKLWVNLRYPTWNPFGTRQLCSETASDLTELEMNPTLEIEDRTFGTELCRWGIGLDPTTCQSWSSSMFDNFNGSKIQL